MTALNPKPPWRCASLRLARPAGVIDTARVRASGPALRSTQPAASSGFRLRVSVDGSIFSASARSTGRAGPSWSTVDSSEYCVVFSPAAAMWTS